MTEMFSSDADAMRAALEQAYEARRRDEIPVGAVLIDASGRCLGRGFNRTISDHDPSGHAEIVALRAAGVQLRNHRMPGATLFVTLEPCMMCLGAIFHARLARVVYGASDPKTGACGGLLALHTQPQLNHHTRFEGGLLAAECSTVLREFFRLRRA